MPSLMPKYMTACLFAMDIENVFQASTQMWGKRKVAYSLEF
jgi:DNA-binding XRE family transcriptional regulator